MSNSDNKHSVFKMTDQSAVVATTLSIFCSIVLILVWTVDSKWRSLHNFINIHQIVIGTLHLCLIYLNWGIGVYEFSFILLHASMCWTLCASLLAYIRLVLLVTGKISYGKRKAAAFSYGTLAIDFIVYKLAVPTIFELQGREYYMEPMVAGAYFLMFLNMMVVFKVMSSVLSCCKKRISSTGGTRALSLVGIAILCDIITLISLAVPLLLVFDYLFNFRLVLHTFVVLFNKTSVEHFKKQWQKWKRANQVLELQIFNKE